MGKTVTDFNKVLERCFKFCIHQQINYITKGINQYMSQIYAWEMFSIFRVSVDRI